MLETSHASFRKQATQQLEHTLEHPYFYYLALQRVPHLGPRGFKKCMQAFDTPKQTFFVNETQLKEQGLKQKAVDVILQLKNLFNKNAIELLDHIIIQGAQQDIAWLDQSNHFVVCQTDSQYPEPLKQIYDAPALLFVIGNLKLLQAPQLAIVGSRRPSKTGTIDTYEFAKALTKAGLTITSGLATGIDTFAHQGSLAGRASFASTVQSPSTQPSTQASTIAVVAHGLDSIYPKGNAALAANIINNNGAIVSEFPVGVKPRPEYFPRRNRIISGLTLGVLVVEAAIKSGSLITAYSALEQNREVFAIPGSIHNPVSKGCHQLIKKGAKLVETIQDVLEELPELENINTDSQSADPSHLDSAAISGLSKQQQEILAQLNHEEQSANNLSLILNCSVSEVSSALIILELKGLIVQGEAGYSK